MAGKILPTVQKKQSKKRNPTSVLRRNARERDRIQTVNNAFDHLRNHVPNGDAPKGRKISKVETLKSAIEYIHALRSILGDDVCPMSSLFDDQLSDSDFNDDLTPDASPESGLGSNETSLDYDSQTCSPRKENNIESVTFGTSPKHQYDGGDIYPAFQTSDDSQLSPQSATSLPDPVGFENYDFNNLALQSALPNCQSFDVTLSDYHNEQFEFC